MYLLRSILLLLTLSSFAVANDYDEQELANRATAPNVLWVPRTSIGYEPLPANFDPESYVLIHKPQRPKHQKGWYEKATSYFYSWCGALWE